MLVYVLAGVASVATIQSLLEPAWAHVALVALNVLQTVALAYITARWKRDVTGRS